jgi:hypothetical protein
MEERRTEERMLCAELVKIEWRDKSGRRCVRTAHVEDISLSGACVSLETTVIRGAEIAIRYGDGELKGTIQYCLYRDGSYFLGIQFTEGCKWSSRHYKPEHLLDPGALITRAMDRRLPRN